MAFALNDEFDCPNCDDKEIFRGNMLMNGIYIPSDDYLPPESTAVGNQPKRKRVKSQQCAAAVYLLFDAKNTSVHLYRADSPHTHDDEICKNNVVTKISGVLETEIRAMFELGTSG